MILIIDAFNVIYKFPDLEDAMLRNDLVAARKNLLKLLISFRKRWKKPLQMLVFVDGKKNPGDDTSSESIEEIQVFYSIDRSADYLIREYLKSVKSPGEIRVISSDKEVLYYARKFRCHAQSSEEFATWVSNTLMHREDRDGAMDPGENSRPSTDDVAYWQSVFSKERKSQKNALSTHQQATSRPKPARKRK